MKNEEGQVILVLILVMTVALAIGISVIQRSISDISTSSKVEQSSRAFSAAEAGIEKALSGGTRFVNFPDNNSSATVTTNDLIPIIPTNPTRQDVFECPPGNSGLAKEDITQVWLADYTSVSNPPPGAYKQNSLDVYWGNSTLDKAALELTLVYFDGTQYKNRKWYLDHTFTRSPDNKFPQVACTGYTVGANSYQCKYTIGGSGDPGGVLPSSFPSILMLLRARLLYNTASQPFAVQAAAGTVCSQSNKDACIPSQAKVVVSKGVAGQTQRTVQVCQLQKVVPPYFDYAIFSTGAINK